MSACGTHPKVFQLPGLTVLILLACFLLGPLTPLIALTQSGRDCCARMKTRCCARSGKHGKTSDGARLEAAKHCAGSCQTGTAGMAGSSAIVLTRQASVVDLRDNGRLSLILRAGTPSDNRDSSLHQRPPPHLFLT